MTTTAHAARSTLALARRVVVKVGSALLRDEAAFARYADEIAALIAEGRQVVVVSSGAIALGYPLLGYGERPVDLAGLQASASAGQGLLIEKWAAAFRAHGRTVAQVLLTHGDLEHRRRYLNARHALERLLERGAIPIVNENDTVSVDEIKLGDNDVLAAAVCGLTSSSVVVLLTGADGLFTADPSVDPRATRIPVVEDIDDEVRARAGPPAALGTGGMVTKVRAAELARTHGAATVVAPGRRPEVLRDVLGGADVGTLFVAPGLAPARARKRWIATALRARGTLFVDEGARKAVVQDKSLLLPGVKGCEGAFLVGDPVDIRVEGGDAPFARGLVAIAAVDLERVKGMRNADARRHLGVPLPDEVVHKDDLVVLARPPRAEEER